MERINNIIGRKNGIITTEEISGKAEYKRILRAVDRGEVIRIRHGVYAEPTSIINTMIDVEKIIPNGVVCLYNAWEYHRLSTKVPPAFCIAIEAKRKVSIPTTIPINLYYWKRENLNFGIEEKELCGYKIRITDLERSVCDAIKYRNKIGMDICAGVVKSYLRKKERNISRLIAYAKKLRVSNILNNNLEISME